RSAPTDDHVHGALGGVDHVGRGRHRNWRQSAVVFVAADGMGALVVMLVTANHEIHAVPVEQGVPLFADTEIGTVEGRAGGGDGHLVHAHHDPVDLAIGARRREFLLKPGLLGARRVAADEGVAAVLIDNIVIGYADHPDRAGGEGVPKAARDLG